MSHTQLPPNTVNISDRNSQAGWAPRNALNDTTEGKPARLWRTINEYITSGDVEAEGDLWVARLQRRISQPTHAGRKLECATYQALMRTKLVK